MATVAELPDNEETRQIVGNWMQSCDTRQQWWKSVDPQRITDYIAENAELLLVDKTSSK